MSRPRSTPTTGLLLATIGLLLVGPRPAAARQRGEDPPIRIENIRVGLAEDFKDQAYKIGTWTPVRVDLQAGPDRFRGDLRLSVPDDAGVPTYTHRRVEVPARTTESFLSYVRPGDSTVEFIAEVYDEARGRRRASGRHDDAVWIDPDQLVIASLGHAGGLDKVIGRAEFQPDQSNPTAPVTRLFLAKVGVPDGLPDQWYGYDAAEVVVLDTNDRAALDALQDFRSLPLSRWVRNGGHLVVAIGANWQAVASGDSALRDLLPALPTGRTDITEDPGALESFAGSASGLPIGEDRRLLVTNFEPVDGRTVQTLLDARALGGPVIVRGSYGLGRVTLVGLDVDQRPFVDWEDRDSFWLPILDLGGREPVIAGPANATFYGYELRDLSSYLHRSLEQFEGVRLVPFGWVAFFVFLYILMIGPGDYFFLKKVVKRMELTWITFPAIVVAVSLVAYVAAYWIKGTDLRLNRVDVVDVDQRDGGEDDESRSLVRGTSFATLFSPQNRDYDVTMLPLPIDAADPSAEPPADPKTVEQVIMTWFGQAEQRFGGMGNTGGTALTSSGYSYESFGDPLSSQPPERLQGVRVPIWTTKALVGTWYDAAPAALSVRLRDLGADRLEGTVTNRLGRTLRDAVLLYGDEVYLFERPIEPNETIRVDTLPNRSLAGYLGQFREGLGQVYTYDVDARVNVSRSGLVRALSFARGARQQGQAKPNLVLSDLDLTAQLALGRPILLADLDGPSAALLLDGEVPAEALRSESTVLRVLLPPPAARR